MRVVAVLFLAISIVLAYPKPDVVQTTYDDVNGDVTAQKSVTDGDGETSQTIENGVNPGDNNGFLANNPVFSPSPDNGNGNNNEGGTNDADNGNENGADSENANDADNGNDNDANNGNNKKVDNFTSTVEQSSSSSTTNTDDNGNVSTVGNSSNSSGTVKGTQVNDNGNVYGSQSVEATGENSSLQGQNGEYNLKNDEFNVNEQASKNADGETSYANHYSNTNSE